jgi:hypothetical protein
MDKGEIIIYQASDGTTNLEVRLEEGTVWLTQAQMSELFQRERTVISKHIHNIFKEGELQEKMVCANFAHTTQHGAIGGKTQTTVVQRYNLDVIISVGYRVKSQHGTQFRIWANCVLKDYLIKGYAVNQNVKLAQLEDLKKTVKLLSKVIQHKELTAAEAIGLLKVISDYTYALDTLDRYDYQQLHVEQTTKTGEFQATYDNAMDAIRQLKQKFKGSDLFANEKDQSFCSSIATIYQTFDGKDLYPSLEEKAAMYSTLL